MATNADIWRERNGTVQRIAQGVASGYTPSDVQADDRFYVLPPGERPVGPGAPKPLLQNLQLYADYENWTAGDPLPNRYPDNSGIPSLTDNNSVQAETTNPLVGGKSGKYVKSNNEYHVTSEAPDYSGKDVYFSCWFISGNGALISNLTTDPDDHGIELRVTNLKIELAYFESGGAFSKLIGPSISTGQLHFVEAWVINGNPRLRLDDGTLHSKTGDIVQDPSSLGIASRPSGTFIKSDKKIDNVAVEAATGGELRWPSASGWLYNGGAGRSWSEIQSYTP